MLQPLDPQNVQVTVNVLLAYLDDPRQSTPNDQLDGIVSAKSLCRAILKGDVVVCKDVPKPAAKPVKRPPPPGSKAGKLAALEGEAAEVGKEEESQAEPSIETGK